MRRVDTRNFYLYYTYVHLKKYENYANLFLVRFLRQNIAFSLLKSNLLYQNLLQHRFIIREAQAGV